MTSSAGFTFLDDAFDMGGPAAAQQPAAASVETPHQQMYQQYAAPVSARQQQQHHGGGGGQETAAQKAQAAAHQAMVRDVLQELGKYLYVKEQEAKSHQEQLYSMMMSKQTEGTESTAVMIREHCTSLEILMFINIAALVVVIIVQIVLCSKLGGK